MAGGSILPAMRLADHFTGSGAFFFRWRSFLPLLLVPAFVASFLGPRISLRSPALSLAWEISCFLIAGLGVGIRLAVTGTAPRGTSGRNTRQQKADVLNTTGPYSLVRHPLYVGNYLIALGLAAFPRTWFLPVIVTLAALLYYERIAAQEEHYLEGKFGNAFRQWATQVPAALPIFAHYRPAALPFRWRVALAREFYAVFLVTAAFFALDVLDTYVSTGRPYPHAVWAAMFLAGTLFFVVMRSLKKRGQLARRPEVPAL
jgi:protein-S-isoprenylcysteine O-methyltransferase Ste14